MSERREIIENIEIPWQKTVIKELRGICALAFPIVPLVEGWSRSFQSFVPHHITCAKNKNFANEHWLVVSKRLRIESFYMEVILTFFLPLIPSINHQPSIGLLSAVICPSNLTPRGFLLKINFSIPSPQVHWDVFARVRTYTGNLGRRIRTKMQYLSLKILKSMVTMSKKYL